MNLTNGKCVAFMIQFITVMKNLLRWFFSEKYINGELNIKARLVVKGLQKVNSDILG